MVEITTGNQMVDIPALNSFHIGDKVIVDASTDNDRFEGVIIGIELRRVYGSNRLEPSITLLHDGYITDEFRPIDCRKVDPAPPQTKSVLSPVVGPEALTPCAEPLGENISKIGASEGRKTGDSGLTALFDNLGSARVAEDTGIAFHNGLRTEARAQASPSRRKIGDEAHVEQMPEKETPASPETNMRCSEDEPAHISERSDNGNGHEHHAGPNRNSTTQPTRESYSQRVGHDDPRRDRADNEDNSPAHIQSPLDLAIELTEAPASPQSHVRWLPIGRADKATDRIYDYPGMPRPIGNSEEYWCRDADGRVFLATWADDGKRAYWWDLEGESPVDPVEFMPHPLDPRWQETTEGQP